MAPYPLIKKMLLGPTSNFSTLIQYLFWFLQARAYPVTNVAPYPLIKKMLLCPTSNFSSLIQYLFWFFTGESLSCYRCGTLSSNARKIEDCQGPKTVEVCAANEACVVFKRLYKKGSGKFKLTR